MKCEDKSDKYLKLLLAHTELNKHYRIIYFHTIYVFVLFKHKHLQLTQFKLNI